MNKSKPELSQIKRHIQKSANQQKNRETYQIPTPKTVVDDAVLRPQALVPRRTNLIAAWAIFAVTLIVYMLTQARSLSFWDSGEYATCISILGVPHPPGNPFYIIFGRALVVLFGGLIHHAWIAAFISALSSAFALMLTYLITVQLTSMFKIKYWEAVFAGVIAALLTAFSFTFWMNAVEAEVYAGLSLFINLIIWLTLSWLQKSHDYHHQNYFLLIIYLFILGFSVHQTALQIAPAIFLIIAYPKIHSGNWKNNFWIKFAAYHLSLILAHIFLGNIGIGLVLLAMIIWELRNLLNFRVWLLGAVLIVIGLAPHWYLKVRAADRPFINEGNPSTLKGLQDYVSRQQYKSQEKKSIFAREGNLITDQYGKHFLQYFGWQWFKPDTVSRYLKTKEILIQLFAGLFTAFLGLFGALFHFRMNKHSFAYLLSIVFCTTILMVWVMNIPSATPRPRDYFYAVGYNMWAIWMGIGALGVIRLFDHKTIRTAMAVLLLLIPVLNMAVQYHEHDRSKELIALDYGVNFLNSVEENAIIFTNGDNDTFPIWYAQAVQDPYATEHMHAARDIFPTDESRALIDKAMKYKNPRLKGIRKDVTVANLSLLNTPWYLKQLRDLEGVKVTWPDNVIDGLSMGTYGAQVEFNAGDPENKMNFTLTYPEIREFKAPQRQSYDKYYHVSDQAVIQIIKDNFGKRPIYFAVTCDNYAGFDDYLRFEGMVYRLVSTKDDSDDQIDLDRLLVNLDKHYQYRSIEDEKIYKDSNIKSLIRNYASAYVQAAVELAKRKDFARAQRYYDRSSIFIDGNIKLPDYLMRYYLGTKQFAKLDAFLESDIYSHNDIIADYYFLDMVALEYPEHLIIYLEKYLKRGPDNTEMAQVAYQLIRQYGYKDKIDAMFASMQSEIGYDWKILYQQFEASYAADSLDANEPDI